MAKRSVTTNELPIGTTMQFTGKLSYSRLTSFIKGDELLKDQQRRVGNNMPIIDRPYVTATIYDAKIIPHNPAQNNAIDIFATESLYQSKSHAGYSFTGLNKGTILPWVGVRNPDNSVSQIKLEGELASDLQVTLLMNVFGSKMNNGVSLVGVIVEEPIKYYQGSGSAESQLSDLGIVFKPLPAEQMEVDTNVVNDSTQMTMDNNVNQQPMGAPYVQTPVQQEVPNMQTPVQQEVPNMQNPVQQGAPYVQTPVQQGAPYVQTPVQQGAPMQAEEINPFQNDNNAYSDTSSNNGEGIVMDTNRKY